MVFRSCLSPRSPVGPCSRALFPDPLRPDQGTLAIPGMPNRKTAGNISISVLLFLRFRRICQAQKSALQRLAATTFCGGTAPICHAARSPSWTSGPPHEDESIRVAAARPKALPMAEGPTIGKLALAAATRLVAAHFPRSEASARRMESAPVPVLGPGLSLSLRMTELGWPPQRLRLPHPLHSGQLIDGRRQRESIPGTGFRCEKSWRPGVWPGT
jgi:hypothetical protein